MSAFLDAERCSVSGGRQSGKQEKHFSATRYERIVGPQLVFPHIQRPHAAGQQLSAFSPGLTHTHLLLIHTHMPLSAMISGRLDSLQSPSEMSAAAAQGWIHSQREKKKKMQRRYLFQSLTQFQEIIGRYFKDADDRILKKNVKIQLANRV